MRGPLLVILLSWTMVDAIAKPVQCPSSDSIYQRIVAITKTDLPSEKDRLSQLLTLDKETKNCPTRNDSINAYLLRRIGVAYGNVADYPKAIAYTNQAIETIRSNAGKSSVNLSQLHICYYNLYLYYELTEQEGLKWEAIDSCIAVDLRVGSNYFYSSYLLREKIKYLFNKGDYYRCISYASLMEKFLHNSDTTQLDAKCFLIAYHANALIFLKRYKEAEDLLQSEMHSFRACPKHMGSLYNLFGIINVYFGSHEKSLYYFFKSVDSSRRTGYNIGMAESLLWVGFLYGDSLNQPRLGLSYLKKALLYSDSIDGIVIQSNIGRAYTRLNSFDSAFISFQRAFNMIKPGCTERTVINEILNERSEGKTISYVTNLLINKGDTYLKLYTKNKDSHSITEALNIYRIADQLLNNLQAIHRELGSKLFWRDNTRKLYESAIEACYLSGKTENAFYFFERGRSAILNAQLNEQRWLPETEMIKLSHLRKKIYEMERTLHETGKNSTKYLELEKTVFENKQQLEALQEKIKVSSPLYFQNFIDTSAVRIVDVQKQILKDHQAVVELFAGDSAVYMLVVEPDKVNIRKFNKSTFDSLSRVYINFISNVELLNLKYNEFLQAAHSLYNLLFQGLAIPKGRIIVSPDGKYFPFEALVTSLQPPTYYLEDHAVSYTYSVRYLLNNSTKNEGVGKGFFGIAPIQFSPSWQLPDLNGSDESLDRINNNFSKVTSLVGKEATRQNFLRDFYKYRIIQLYTHATDSGSSGEPMIYFSDSTLSLSELIYGHKPITSLVVLSACQTGLGKLYNGEGVFNFNRGFAAMGVPSSISNLWEIETKSTYELTELFYKNLAKGLAADLALQKAKKDFMSMGSRRNQLPYLWAAPILVGNSNYSLEENSFSWKWLFLLIPVLLLLTWWLGRFLLKKKT